LYTVARDTPKCCATTSIDRRTSRYDAVAEELFVVQAERAGPVHDELVQLRERAFVDERLNAFACGAFAAGVLLFDGVSSGGGLRQGTLTRELFVLLFVGSHEPKRYAPESSLPSSRSRFHKQILRIESFLFLRRRFHGEDVLAVSAFGSTG